MSIESIQSVLPAIGEVAAGKSAAATAGGSVPDGRGFGQMVARGLEEVNGQLLATQTDLQQLALGDTRNLHQIMIRMEESRMSFQLLLQVRNRLLEGYQDLMKMQV